MLLWAGDVDARKFSPSVGDVVFQIDANQKQSYPGSGDKWLDVSGNSNDFFVGDDASGTDGPVYNSSTKQFDFSDVADHFTFTKAADAVTEINNISRTDTNQAAVFAIVFKTGSSLASSPIMFTNGTNTTGEPSFEIRINSNGSFAATIFGDSSFESINLYAGGTFSTNTTYCLIVGLSDSEFRGYLNSRTAVSNSGISLDTCTSDPVESLNISQRPGLTTRGLGNGAWVKHAMLVASQLDDTIAGEIFDFYNSLDGVTYA